MKVNQRSAEVETMAKDWPISHALLGGTRAMRDAGKAWLPQQPREDDEDYRYRLSVATLFPAWERTLTVMAGKPFSKEMTLTEDVPEKLVKWLENCDLYNRNFHTFASDLLIESMAFGIAGVLVDYSRVDVQLKTRQLEASAGVRPYFVQVNHDQILGWRTGRVNGVEQLTQLRLRETAEVEDGLYGLRTVDRVRVHMPGAWELWQKSDAKDEEYILIDKGTTTLDTIPYVPFYGRRLGFMRGVSPLLNLAYLNVEHWQESSDQKDSTRFARKRLLVLSGITAAEDITASSNYAVNLPADGRAEIVQGSAESVTVGRSEIDALEDRMIQSGAELLVPKTGVKTATEASNDAEANKSELQRIVEQFEDGLDQCLQLMGRWVKIEETGKVSLFKDFGASTLTDASAQLVMAMRADGLITRQTAIREQQRRGVLSPDINPETELDAVGMEGPDLGLMRDDGE